MLLDDLMGIASPLPDEIIQEISHYLSLPDQVALKNASKCTYRAINRYGVFQSNFDKEAKEAQSLKLQVLHGCEDAALKQLKEKPYLFFIETGPVPEYAKDHKGTARMVAGSAFQAALAMGYTQLLKSSIVQAVIQANPKTAARQIKKQFPKGFNFPLENEAEIDCAFADFAKVFINDKFVGGYGQASASTVMATAKLRDSFALTTVNQGWLFDLRILVKTINVYKENYRKWNDEKCCWFLCQIYGYLQTLVSAFDAQIFREGLTSVMEDTDKIGVVPESLTLKDDGFYYPDHQNQLQGVGADSYIGMSAGLRGGQRGYDGIVLGGYLEMLYRAKISELRHLKKQLYKAANLRTEASTPSCIIS